MGLDLVELAMAVETEFRLTMTDAEAADLCTAGDVHRFVCGRVRQQPAQCLSQRAFQAVRRVLLAVGVKRREVTLDFYLDPMALDWKSLEKELGQPLKPLGAVSFASWLGLARESRTVREVVVALADQLPGQDWAWTEARIWSRLVKVICQVLGVTDEMVRPETDFILDLGAN